MQDKTNKEFDSFVRSMLENAQEQAPEGIWESIESRLPQPRRTPAVWWCWAGAGLAAAAAALGAIFLTNVSDKELPVVPTAVPVVAEAVRNTVPFNTEAAVPAPAVSDVSTYLALAEPSQESVQDPEMPQAISEGFKPAVNDVRSQKASAQKVEEYKVNPFAGSDENTSRKIRTQIQFDGLVGSNDVSQVSLFNNPVIKGAPSTSTSSSPISELSESSYNIPVTFGLGLRFYMNEKLSFGTGVDFSLLSRTFDGSYKGGTSCSINHNLKYIGIPVNLYYDLLNSDNIKVYSFVGGTVEKAISNNYVINNGSEPVTYSEKVNGLQWSANLGLGVQFNLSNNIGLFIDPSARYYFDCDQPKSIRTKNSIMFGFEAGLRFDL